MATKAVATKGETNGVVDLPAELVKQFAEMARTLPRADEEGGARMLEAILNASSPEALNAVTEGIDSAKLAGEELVMESLSISPSDHAGGLGFFLVVKGIRVATGEPVTFTTGSMQTVAGLVRAHAQGWLPMAAKIVVADKPTKNGFYPQSLRIIKTNV